MCLLGVVYPKKGGCFLFKNRDLEYRPNIPYPKIIENGSEDYPGNKKFNEIVLPFL